MFRVVEELYLGIRALFLYLMQVGSGKRAPFARRDYVVTAPGAVRVRSNRSR